MESVGCESQEVSPVSLLTRQLQFANFNNTPKYKLNYNGDDDVPTPTLKKEVVPRAKKYAKRVNSSNQRSFGTSLHNLKSAVYDECANLEPPCSYNKEDSSIPSTNSDFSDFGRSISSESSGFGDEYSYTDINRQLSKSKSSFGNINCNILMLGGSCSLESSAPDEGFICGDVSSDETVIVSDGEESSILTSRSPVLTARRLFTVNERSSGKSPFCCNESSDNGFVLRRRSSVPVMADLVRQNSMAAEMTGYVKRRQQFGLPAFLDHDEEDCYVTSESSSPDARGQTRRQCIDSAKKETQQQQTTPKRRRPCLISSGDTPVIPGGVLSSSNIDIPSTMFSPMQELFNIKKHSAKKSSRRSSGVPALSRCLSASMALDENKVAKSIYARDHNKFADDCQSGNVLPVLESLTGCRQFEVHCISLQTTCDLISGRYNDKISDFTVIDCRYPYEFDGGHIKDAANIYTHEQLVNSFLYPLEKEAHCAPSHVHRKPSVLVFHCEFSSQRAPTLAKFLRSQDRSFNIHRYPSLFYPEVYILQGGYSEFYKCFPAMCVPDDYIKMFDDRYKKDLIQSKRLTQVSKKACMDKLGKRSMRSNKYFNSSTDQVNIS